MLVEIWKRGSEFQLHLVNYARKPVSIFVDFGNKVRGQILSPTQNNLEIEGILVNFDLDIYSIIVWTEIQL